MVNWDKVLGAIKDVLVENDWECPKCGTLNMGGRINCGLCGSFRPAIQEVFKGKEQKLAEMI